MPEALTLLYGDRVSSIANARVDGDDLWLRLDDLTSATGWVIKPEGACLGDNCVPLPDDNRDQYLREEADGTRFNLAALARLLGMPFAVERQTNTWCFGEGVGSRAVATGSNAPDFRLPDLTGRMHALSDYHGQKVFIVAWASW